MATTSNAFAGKGTQFRRWDGSTTWDAIAEIRERIISEGIPIFPSPERAASAMRRYVDYWVSRAKNSCEPSNNGD